MNPHLNADGTRITFAGRSTCNDPSKRGLFLFDTVLQTLTQITEGDSLFWSTMDATGTIVVFSTDANLTGQNPGHFWQLFLFDATRNTRKSTVGCRHSLTQLTQTTSDSGPVGCP